MSTIIDTPLAPAAIGPYVQGVDLGNLLFTSGQLPINSETGLMADDIAAQTLQSLLNVKAIVESGGMSINNVFKMTIFVKDMNTFSTVNEVYQTFFNDNKVDSFPARSCVEVARLPKDALIEIEAIAAK